MPGKKHGAVLAVTIVLAIVMVVSGADRASGQTDLHVLLPAGAGHGSLIDLVGGPGLDPGDGVVGRGPVVDGETGENAGSVYFECTVMRKIRSDEEGLWRCSYQLRLADGAIVLQGSTHAGPVRQRLPCWAARRRTEPHRGRPCSPTPMMGRTC
jgi:hypothetical protein